MKLSVVGWDDPCIVHTLYRLQVWVICFPHQNTLKILTIMGRNEKGEVCWKHYWIKLDEDNFEVKDEIFMS